jgi:ribonuclease D
MPKTAEDLHAVRGVVDKIGRQATAGLLGAVARGVAVPDEELPALTKRKRIAVDVDAAVDLMIAIVRLRARQNGVAMPLLASRSDLERFAAGEREGHPLLDGWRRTMVGNELVELLEGRLTMRLDDGELVVSPVSE